MFTFFSRAKTNYQLTLEKGQIAPVLIAVLAVIVMAIMITVNIGKIGEIKTHVSNSVDAGALAGASLMATGFDYLVYLSAMMYAEYVSYLFMIEGIYDTAMSNLETSVGLYMSAAVLYYAAGVIMWIPYLIWLGWILIAIAGVIAAVASAFWSAVLGNEMSMFQLIKDCYTNQIKLYQQIRKTMITWVDNARGAAYNYASGNRGMSEDEAKGEWTDGEWTGGTWSAQDKAWLNQAWTEGYWTEGSWTDGQGRLHKVDINVYLDYIQAYNLYHTNLTYCELRSISNDFETAQMIASIIFAVGVIMGGMGYGSSLYGGIIVASNAVTSGQVLANFLEEMVDGFGISPSIYTDATSPTSMQSSAGLNIIVAIQDVTHSRTVTVDSTQQHQGADLGLWQSTYPDTYGITSASFAGGVISPLPFGGMTDHWPRLISAH